AATSGFSVGVGGSSCLCGSISAAVVCLGYFFGRDFPSTMTDPKSLKSIALAYELQEKFKVKNQSLCCHFHKKENCAELAGDAAELSAEIIAREFGIKLTDGGAK
ncbi:MAG: C-GCAxxG-C-C family protein, partial [Defluviitaleaceae bacterium]|nr:C-GCAxxG-C-C family protein [Defluviitaleaceae bacterium]